MTLLSAKGKHFIRDLFTFAEFSIGRQGSFFTGRQVLPYTKN